MPLDTSCAPHLTALPDGGWRLSGWASRQVVAGLTDRHVDDRRLLAALGPDAAVEAGQVHGSGIAVVTHAPPPDGAARPPRIVPGCDALLTHVAGVALVVRTADCLPIFFADPRRSVVGIAHVGWRGLVGRLPARVVAAFRHAYHTQVQELSVAIGPAIRSCCYEVGAEFTGWFGPFVREQGSRRTCDLAGAAVDELRRCGVRAGRIVDVLACTACDTQRWSSWRREGPSSGRLTSLIMWRP